MGYTKAPTILTLDKIEGEDGLIIRLKGLKVGKLRRLVKVLDSDEAGLTQVLDEIFAIMLESAVSWNLQDEDGNDIPFELAGLEDLELDTVLAITRAWIDGMTGVSDELGKDSTSGGQFPGQPLTMAAL